MEQRLDKLMVQKGLAGSRERAKELIENKHVLVQGQPVDKPGKLVPEDAEITLLQQEIPWVSRGALKLMAALEEFQVSIADTICLDLGASTGGFTEVLLSRGAALVYAVDVGHGQLVEKLRNHPHVVNLEKTHVKDLSSALIPQKPDVCVIDVSFISLEKVLPFLPPLLAEKTAIIALVKPQFEVGKANLNAKGVVKEPKLYADVLQHIIRVAENLGFTFMGSMDSPILGGDGNKEFLIHLKR